MAPDRQFPSVQRRKKLLWWSWWPKGNVIKFLQCKSTWNSCQTLIFLGHFSVFFLFMFCTSNWNICQVVTFQIFGAFTTLTFYRFWWWQMLFVWTQVGCAEKNFEISQGTPQKDRKNCWARIWWEISWRAFYWIYEKDLSLKMIDNCFMTTQEKIGREAP